MSLSSVTRILYFIRILHGFEIVLNVWRNEENFSVESQVHTLSWVGNGAEWCGVPKLRGPLRLPNTLPPYSSHPHERTQTRAVLTCSSVLAQDGMLVPFLREHTQGGWKCFLSFLLVERCLRHRRNMDFFFFHW